MSTGTWTRHAAQIAALGPEVIYANDADSTYFTSLNTAVDWLSPHALH